MLRAGFRTGSRLGRGAVVVVVRKHALVEFVAEDSAGLALEVRPPEEAVAVAVVASEGFGRGKLIKILTTFEK